MSGGRPRTAAGSCGACCAAAASGVLRRAAAVTARFAPLRSPRRAARLLQVTGMLAITRGRCAAAHSAAPWQTPASRRAAAWLRQRRAAARRPGRPAREGAAAVRVSGRLLWLSASNHGRQGGASAHHWDGAGCRGCGRAAGGRGGGWRLAASGAKGRAKQWAAPGCVSLPRGGARPALKRRDAALRKTTSQQPGPERQ